MTTFPELTWERCRHIETGWDHIVLILDKRIVFRFPRNSVAASRFDMENNFLKLLAPKVKMKIPVYTYIAPDKSFYGYDMIPGRPLRTWYFKKQLTPQQKSICKTKIAAFLSGVHSLPEEVTAMFKRESETPLDHIRRTKDLAHGQLPARLHKHEVSIVHEFLEESESLFQKSLTKQTLIHGDVSAANMLWEPETASLHMIDFSDCGYFDPAYDFSHLFDFGSGFVRDVYAQYSGPKDHDFLKRAASFWKERSVRHMIQSMDGDPNCDFEKSYRSFKAQFRIKKT